MKKGNKELLFERMHKVAGMPINKLNENEVSTNDDVEDNIENIKTDEESSNYEVKLNNISKYINELHSKIKNFDDLPAWVEDKITITEDNIEAINDWAESKQYDKNQNGDNEDENSDDDIKISDEDLDQLSN